MSGNRLWWILVLLSSVPPTLEVLLVLLPKIPHLLAMTQFVQFFPIVPVREAHSQVELRNEQGIAEPLAEPVQEVCSGLRIQERQQWSIE